MKRKFIILSGLVIGGLVIFTCFTIFAFKKTQSNDPSQTVQRFFELSESGDYAEIKKITTYYPKEYDIAQDKWLELYRKSKGIPTVKKTVEEKPDDPNIRQIRGPVPTKSEKEPTVTISEGVPERINQEKLYISEIENVWIKGDESRVRVIIKSRDSEKYRGESDYLLYKIDGKWKIFMEDIPPSIPVYGMPEQ
jgi:hypothetical protein